MYDGVFYSQKHGGAIGSPVSQVVTDIYVKNFEVKALQSFSGVIPRVWRRYVDDTFVVILEGMCDKFFHHINNVNEFLEFTKEPMKEQKTIPFLDTLVSVEENSLLRVRVYRKPTHTDQYLPLDSMHPLENKLSMVRTMYHREETVVMQWDDIVEEKRHVGEALKKC